MILLSDETEVLEILTTTAANIDYVVSYKELPSLTNFSAQGKINSAVSTFIVFEPTTGFKKQINLITIRNIHTSLSNTVTVKKQITGNTYTLTSDIILLPGEMVEYVEESGWQVYDSTGLKKKLESDFYLEISKGNVPGYIDYSAVGINPVISTGTVPEDIWPNGGLFVAPTTYRLHNIVSTNANDTAAGTGAQSVRIYGVVSTGLADEVVVLNGITPVTTVNAYSDIYLMFLYSAGVNGTNAGIISATAAVDGTVTASILANGLNTARKAIRLIPPGYTGYLYDFQGGMQQNVASSSADVYLLTKDSTNVWLTRNYHGLNNSGDSIELDEFKIPIKLSEGTWVKIQCTNVTNNNTIVQGEFTLLLIKNS